MPFPLIVLLGIGIIVAGALTLGRNVDGGTDEEDEADGMEATEVNDLDIAMGQLGYTFRASPNKGSRSGTKVTQLVWHYTAGATAKGAIEWLCTSKDDGGPQASAHFVIGRDGEITQLVSLNEAAWHAGDSACNRRSIGVEVVNIGIVEPDDDGGWTSYQGPWKPDGVAPVQKTLRYPDGRTMTKWWVPYTAAQKRAIKELQARLAASPWSACLRDQVGHEDIIPLQKSDPGPLFPWDELVAFNDRKNHKTTVA